MKVSNTPRETGSFQLKRKFLWFPKKIDNEIRWLETAAWIDMWETRWRVKDGKERTAWWSCFFVHRTACNVQVRTIPGPRER